MLIRLHASRAYTSTVRDWRYYTAKFCYPFISLMGVVPQISPDVVRSRRVPSLAGHTQTRGGTILLVGCFGGMVFGGIHCVCWNFPFQSHIEQMLWRVASLAILCSLISIAIDYWIVKSLWIGMLRFFLSATQLVGFVYITARLTLIVLILLSFRSLPPGVYDTVAWTKFIPPCSKDSLHCSNELREAAWHCIFG
jgi:hypothetical protein